MLWPVNVLEEHIFSKKLI